MSNPILRLAPPWNTYINKIKAIFDNDPEIRIEYDDNPSKPVITMYVENPTKAAALQELLGEEKKFGNIILAITVVPANKKFSSQIDVIKAALEGNPIVTQIETYDVFGAEMTFCEFRKEVIQFPNDDCSDLNGNFNGLAEDLARELFIKTTNSQINYCTAVN